MQANFPVLRTLVGRDSRHLAVPRISFPTMPIFLSCWLHFRRTDAVDRAWFWKPVCDSVVVWWSSSPECVHHGSRGIYGVLRTRFQYGGVGVQVSIDRPWDSWSWVPTFSQCSRSLGVINWFLGSLSIAISSPEKISNGYGWPGLESSGDTDGPKVNSSIPCKPPRKCSLSPLNPCPCPFGIVWTTPFKLIVSERTRPYLGRNLPLCHPNWALLSVLFGTLYSPHTLVLLYNEKKNWNCPIQSLEKGLG